MPPLKLQVFETRSARQQDQTVVMEASAIEDARLQAYEAGYAAGWEDAAAAAQAEQGRVGSELGNNLQRLSFTYQEARTHVLKSVKPVLVLLSTRLLPPLAQEILAPIVLDTVMPLIDDLADTPVRLLLNPASRPAVERLLSQAGGLSLIVEEEPTLGEGQVYLRLGEVEHRIDLDDAVQQIIRAVHDFFEYAEKETGHG